MSAIPLSHQAAGLTLVRASRVFLLEPAMDPAIEQQAVSRVHRIGQVTWAVKQYLSHGFLAWQALIYFFIVTS